jgi:hypothetical protein
MGRQCRSAAAINRCFDGEFAVALALLDSTQAAIKFADERSHEGLPHRLMVLVPFGLSRRVISRQCSEIAASEASP